MEVSDATQHVLQRAGNTIYYWLAGAPDRPLVVLTHGATMDHRMFHPQVSALARHYRVLTWDVPGHGLSQPIGGRFSIRTAVADLNAILDELGYAQAIFVGQSMGGIIAQEMAFLHPERVTALVTIGSECNTLAFSPFSLVGMSMTTAVVHLYPAFMLKPFMACATGIRLDVQAYAYQTSCQISQRDFVKIWEALLTCLHYEPNYCIDHPLLITHGDCDIWGNIKQISPLWAARDPNSRYVVIPFAGHNANQDNPLFFNTVLLDFLREHVPVASL